MKQVRIEDDTEELIDEWLESAPAVVTMQLSFAQAVNYLIRSRLNGEDHNDAHHD